MRYSNLNKNSFGTIVTVTSDYTFPNDGYILNESDTAIIGQVFGASGMAGIHMCPYTRLFVKKGMKVKNITSGYSLIFIPLI